MSDENQLLGAAGDTGNVLDGAALGALFGGNGAAAGFALNYEGLPQGIADLEHAAESSGTERRWRRSWRGSRPRASMGSA